MLKPLACVFLPAFLLGVGAAKAQTQHVVTNDDPAALYAKCTTVGSDDYGSRQCVAFRDAANREISACMSKGAANSHGYRALHLLCADAQARRFAPLAD